MKKLLILLLSIVFCSPIWSVKLTKPISVECSRLYVYDFSEPSSSNPVQSFTGTSRDNVMFDGEKISAINHVDGEEIVIYQHTVDSFEIKESAEEPGLRYYSLNIPKSETSNIFIIVTDLTKNTAIVKTFFVDPDVNDIWGASISVGKLK